jgi:outer membrane protein OmpA-like peptidoglycan-associated protein/opacity protein-like surface antigen
MRTLLLLLVPATAAANPIEIGPTLGGHAFSAEVELGVDDRMDEPGPLSGALIGVRGGYAFLPRLAVEGELVIISTRDDVSRERAAVFGLRTHARFDLLTGELRPFIVAGIGLHALRGGAPQLENDTDRSYHWGAGVRFALSPKLDVRLDIRHLLVPDRTVDGATSDVEFSAGLTYRFGGRRPATSSAAVAPWPRSDRDRDGLRDDSDRCPDQAEDRDDFEDADGCPDLDNDRDGIVDTADRCPFIAESTNGWQDTDGCPDQVITELTGIGFEHDSARIDQASAALLERAFQILRDNPALNVEISGHTSSEGNPQFNFDLSLRRARAVKDHLVKRGIVEGRMLTIGHGADVPVAENATDEGRRKNRRIEFRIVRADEPRR